MSIVQSCNGLLLCSSFRSRDLNRKYYVYNPTIKHFSTLPKPDQETGIRKRICGMSLAFDPAKSSHYKVVCVQHLELDQGEYEYQIEVYSSETGPWKVSSQPFTAEANFEKGVYWNGSIHWVGNGTFESLYFIIDDERLETLPMPPIPDGWEWRSNYYFGESCGHLNFIETFGPQIQFNIYEMKRDYSEWFVKYQVDLSPLVTAFPGMIRSGLNPTDWYYYALSIFCLIRGEKDEDSFLVLQIPGKAIRYNLVYKTFKKLHDFEGAEVEDSLRFSWTNGFQHIESLCCV
ncbi:F-box protein [Forsythia ovata]|uniref:F-box protein n=1 Tax=Forsythia ovata TaxID=205694 RepID=A0ABD1WK60_9LAMI